MNLPKTYFLIFAVMLSTFSMAQSYNNYYGSIVSQCKFDSIDYHLTDLENLGVKELGTTALDNTLNWLINEYTSYGYTNMVIDTFNFSSQNSYNLIVTKTGTKYPNTYVIVDGHYDTKTGTGTNDNGSGVSIILETARLLQSVNTEYSIKFINFSIEELGLIGSDHYVNNTVIPNNLDIKILLNIDEVGGVNGMTNNTIVCERDESNPSVNNVASADFTDTLATCISLYSNLLTEISYAYSSDYMPFQSNNEIITGLFEKNQSTHPHTSTDLKTNMDVNYVYEIAKATIGATLYFAVAYLSNGIKPETASIISIYPNPARAIITINLGDAPLTNTTLKLVNMLGETVIEKQVFNEIEQLNMEEFPSGIYSLIITTPTERFTKKIIH